MNYNLFDIDLSSKKVMKYFLFTLLFIGISGLSFYVIYQMIGDGKVLSLNIFSQQLFIKMAVLIVLYLLLDTLRFYYVLKSINVKVSFKYIFKLAFIYIFISNVTPFATGGGFAQVYFLSKKGVSVGDASAASLIRTFLAFVFFIIVVPAIVLLDSKILNLFPGNYSIGYFGIFIILYSLVIYGTYCLIINPTLIENILHKFLKFLKNKHLIKQKTFEKYVLKLDTEIEKLSENITNYLEGNKKYVILSIIFTLLFLLSFFYFSVLLIQDLNPDVATSKIIISQIIITFMMYIAPTPGSTGVAEGGFTLLFSNFLKKSNIVSVTFAWRLFSIYIPMIIGMLLFYYEIVFNYKGSNEEREMNG